MKCIALYWTRWQHVIILEPFLRLHHVTEERDVDWIIRNGPLFSLSLSLYSVLYCVLEPSLYFVSRVVIGLDVILVPTLVGCGLEAHC